MKKSTNWITIPDETLHTPASKAGSAKKSAVETKHAAYKKKGKNSDLVTSKLFWGIGFVVMAVVVFAALAPNQFNELLRGNLFDAEGTGNPISSPSDLLTPDGVAEESETDESDDTAEAEGDAVETSHGTSLDEEDEGYVSEPVVQPEEDAVTITIDPIVEPEDVDVEIVDGGEPSSDDTAEPSGDQPDTGLADTVETVHEPSQEEDPQAKLIEDLNQQLADLQKQREEDIKAMQELADVTKPSAPEGVPPSITTTTNIGQPSAIQPGFRANTYTVTVTPEEMLRRNMSGGYQIAAQPVVQPAYQVSTPSAVQTPDTGPSEIMFIAFLLTFISLLGWKLIRLSLA